jgi:hypothetical protein
MAECLGDEAGLKDLLNLSICTSDAEEIFSLRERGFSHGCPSVSDVVAGGQSVSVLRKYLYIQYVSTDGKVRVPTSEAKTSTSIFIVLLSFGTTYL